MADQLNRPKMDVKRTFKAAGLKAVFAANIMRVNTAQIANVSIPKGIRDCRANTYCFMDAENY